MKACSYQSGIVVGEIIACRSVYSYQVFKLLFLNVFDNIFDIVRNAEATQISLPGILHPLFFKESDGRIGNYRYLKCDPGFFKARLALQDLFDKRATYFTYSEEYDID